MTFYITDGSGMDVGADFTRADGDIPVIRISHDEFARSGHVIAYIGGSSSSKLGFMRDSIVRVHVRKSAIVER